MSSVSGTIRVAAFQTATRAFLPAALNWLSEHHPQLRLHVTQLEPEASLPALAARDFDVVLGEEYPGQPKPRMSQIEQRDLIHDPMRLALPAGFPDKNLRALAELPWVMEPEGTGPRQWSTALCREAGFEPDVHFESTDLLLHVRLVETGHAAALLPDLIWESDPPTVALRQLPGKPVRRIFTAVRRGAGRQPAVLAVREALTEALAGIRSHDPDRLRKPSRAPRHRSSI